MWQMFGFEVANVRILVANGIKVGVGNDRLVKNTPSNLRCLLYLLSLYSFLLSPQLLVEGFLTRGVQTQNLQCEF